MKSSVLMTIGAILAMTIVTIAACMTNIAPPAKGHEETVLPGVIAAPIGAAASISAIANSAPPPLPKPASREVDHGREDGADPSGGTLPDHCQHITDSAATLRIADDSAALYRDLVGTAAQEFIRAHVPDAPAGVDEVAVYVGDAIAPNTVAVLASGGCVLGVKVTDLKVPE